MGEGEVGMPATGMTGRRLSRRTVVRLGLAMASLPILAACGGSAPAAPAKPAEPAAKPTEAAKPAAPAAASSPAAAAPAAAASPAAGASPLSSRQRDESSIDMSVWHATA